MNDERYRLRVEVSITDNYGGAGLRISEDAEISGMGFDDLAGLLKAFHELTTSIRTARTRPE